MLKRVPRFLPGQPTPEIDLPGLPADVQGFWSLWRIAIHADLGPKASERDAEWNQKQFSRLKTLCIEVSHLLGALCASLGRGVRA